MVKSQLKLSSSVEHLQNIMVKQVIDLLSDFKTLDTSKKDRYVYQELNKLTDQLISVQSDEVVPFFISYIKLVDLPVSVDLPNIKMTHILDIFAHYQNSDSLPVLFKMAENLKFEAYLKEIYLCIGQFRTANARKFLIRHISNHKSRYCSSLALASFPDPIAEEFLLEQLRLTLNQRNFSSEVVDALVSIRNIKVWTILEDYLSKNISERERYKVCSSLLEMNETKVIPLLISCYHYYLAKPDIKYNEVKAISLEGTSLILTKAHRDSIPFPQKMKKKILEKLKLYHSDFRVKTLLRNIYSRVN